ncbi:protein YgfX [Tolumonas lignilytica]|uniref:protein YgfX n=1 Tax=Tolumonas lignilytica TaxID=1283284 RepID=UPI0004647CBA|nr:protein YgfX [Tolumonas lignilytica]
MKNIRHVIRVEPSHHHQLFLVIGHIIVGWLAWTGLHGHLWLVFFIMWGGSLFWSLYQAYHRQFEFEMRGDEIFMDGKFYHVMPASKVGYGFLWLVLHGDKVTHLWLFSDSMDEAEYRRIARRINMRTQ